MWVGGRSRGDLLLQKKLISAVGIRELIGLRIGLTHSIYSDRCDLLFLNGTVLRTGLGRGDGVNHFHTGSNFAEGSVLAVQVLGILMHNEELAACRVGAGGTGHRQNASLMAQVVLKAVKEELTLDAVAGAAHTGAVGTAALNHKAGDDSMENQTIIEI